MKRCILTLCGLMLLCIGLRAQSSNTCRYWFDQNDEQYLMADFGDSPWHVQLDVGHLTDGVHILHMQVMDTTMLWGVPKSCIFTKTSEVGADGMIYHCWFDENHSSMQSGSISDGHVLLDVNDLDEGLHLMHIIIESDRLTSAKSYIFIKDIDYEVDTTGMGGSLTYHFWIDQDYSTLQTGLFGDGNLMLEVAGLELGDHTLHVMLEGTDLTAAKTFEFTVRELSPCPYPDNLVADVNNGSTMLKWTCEGEDFRLQYYSMNNPTPVIVDVSGHSYELIDPAPDTYYWKVQSLCSEVDTGWFVVGPSFFVPYPYNVTATVYPAHGGTVSGGGGFLSDEVCTLTATPNEHFAFTNWTVDGNVVSTEPTISFSVTEDVAIVANFECILPLGEFANMLPADNDLVTSLPVAFSWDAVSGAESYDLYLWDTNEAMPDAPYISGLTNSYYNCASLPNPQTIQWCIKAKNFCNATVSSIKSFTLNVDPLLQVSTNSVDFGEVAMNQGGSSTLNVTGSLLEEGINIQIIGDDASMFSYAVVAGWNEHSGGSLRVNFNPTVIQWEYNATLVISSGSISQSVVLSGTVSEVYVISTYVEENVYPMNTAIPIHGTIADFEGNPVANMDVEINITVMNWKRTLLTVSDENGQFSAVFEPLPMESGYYTVNSGMLGNNNTEVHDSFDIMGMNVVENTLNEGMGVVNSQWVLCDVEQDVPKTGHIKIRNKNSFELTNIQVSVLSAPEGSSFTFVPLNIAGLQEGYLEYTALGTIPTEGYDYQEVRLMATCDQGAEALFTIWFYCAEAQGILEVSPTALDATMVRGESKTIDVTLNNNGMGATGEVTISLPNAEWMSVVGGITLPSIDVNESSTFTLRLSPSFDLPLGQYTGNIAINCEHGESVNLPYSIMSVSDICGSLIVDVTDEFTTNTNDGNGPHVEGAEITLIGYYTLDTVAHGYTDVDGTFSVDCLTEGYYNLRTEKDHHSRHEETIYIFGGRIIRKGVFMQYQGVTYSYVFEPTEIPDEYSIEISMEISVNVPAPVVTIEAPQKIPAFDDTYTFDYVITNHGLIDACNLTLYTPYSDDFLFTALYSHIDTLYANSQVTIPCEVTRKSDSIAGCGDWVQSQVRYGYRSGPKWEYNQAFTYSLIGGSGACDDDLPPLIAGGGGGGVPGGPGPGTVYESILGGHGVPIHSGTVGSIGYGSSSTPMIVNQLPSVDVKVGIQFSQKLTMTREAFIGTFNVHNGHETKAVRNIGLEFIIKDEEGHDRTDLFQISIDTLINVSGIDGNGVLAANSSGVAKILFIPKRQAAPTEPVDYYFGGTFTFVDPNSIAVTRIMNLYPTKLTVHPSPDLHIDYYVAKVFYGDNPLTTDTVEKIIPAELAVRILNKGAGTAFNVKLDSAEPVIISNAQGLPINFGLYGTYMQGVGLQLGLTNIDFDSIESGQSKVGEWLFTSSLLGHVTSYNAHVIHDGSYGKELSLVSHVGIHELIHPIYSQDIRTNGIHDFLVNDVPDENNYPDSIHFSHGGKTSVGVVENISFDRYVTDYDTIVTLTINPSRIGWNYGETEDPGRNRFELVSCIRNNDNKDIPLSNVWQEAMIMPNSGDSLYENKLRIVDTVSAVQTVTYTLVYAGNPSRPPIGAIDGLFSVSNTQKVYFSQGNLQYQASTDTWRFATNQWDYVGGMAVGEHNGNVSGSSNSDISPTYDGWIDLFGWGTSGWDNGNTCYHPWDINVDNDGTLFGPPGLNSLVDEYANADWGVYNPISNGGNKANQWRSLTYWEWNYLLDTRTTPSGVRYAKAQVNGVNGLVLVPDNWDTSKYELQDVNTSTASFDSNVIGQTEWKNTLESSGAVFLPAAGIRFNGTRLYYLNLQGAYWFSTCHGNDVFYASQTVISNDEVGTYSGFRSSGLSIRLVQTMQDNSTYTINTMCSPSMGGTLTGAGAYIRGETCTLTATANEGCTFVNWTKNDVVVSTEAVYSFTVMENAIYVANFSVDEFRFVIPGNWSNASNWLGNALPTQEDDAFIDAPCQLNQNSTVAALVIKEGQSLNVQSGKTLTVSGDLTNTLPEGLVIEDGAQLRHGSDSVFATVKKYIVGYDSLRRGRYCLISNPLVVSISPEDASTNLTNGEYDLYDWLAGSPDSLEWRNYKNVEGGNFNLLPGKGYLYANSDNLELSISGILNRSDNDFGEFVSQVSGESFHYNGWNLIGNPFVCNAYLVNEAGEALPYYRMNAAGRDFDAVVSGAIAPMQGVFYEASENGTVYFTRTAPVSKGGLLELSVNQGGDVVDNVIIRFGEGNTLKKFDFDEESSQLYIPQDGEDYAVVNVGRDGESAFSTDVFFKTTENGQFTITVTIDDMELDYLHLIDNFTGNDVDLLINPSYTFEAHTTDMTSRFKLMIKGR